MSSRGGYRLAAGGVEVRFERRGDRYLHVVLVDGQPALKSVEGAADDAWPPSPPLQELQEQQLTDGRSAILGVGMAGRSHWSLSVTRERDALRFEAACRPFGERGELGSAYRAIIQDPPLVLVVEEGRFDRQGHPWRIHPAENSLTWTWRIEPAAKR